MIRLLLPLFVAFGLSSCSLWQEKEETESQTPVGEKVINVSESINSRVSASAEAIKVANLKNTDTNSKSAINIEADLIIGSTGRGTKTDYDAAVKRVTATLEGRISEAEKAKIAAENLALKEKAEKDKLKDLFIKETAEAKAQIDKMKVELEEQRKENLSLLFGLCGVALCFIGAITLAFSPFKRSGAITVACGITVGTMAFLWESPYFQYSIIACIVILVAGLIFMVFRKDGGQKSE